MTAKEKYRLLCATEKNIPIFSQDWWLDIVCGEENWNVAIVENTGKIIAALPYQFKKKYGFSIILEPILTQYLMLWINYPKDIKNHQKTSLLCKYTYDLLNQLPKFSFFSQNFDYKFNNWMPLYWRGFKQTTKYTYIIRNTQYLDEIYNNFSKSLKSDIKKAQKSVKIYRDLELADFYQLNCKSYSKQKIKNPISYNLLEIIDKECVMKKCREILYAKDDNNNIHSAMYIVWDNEYLYCLLGGTDPKYRKSRSKNLLNLEAIKIANSKNLKFNFEGSMIENVEYFYRQYNCELITYFQIEKVNSRLLKTWFFIKDLF